MWSSFLAQDWPASAMIENGLVGTGASKTVPTSTPVRAECNNTALMPRMRKCVSLDFSSDLASRAVTQLPSTSHSTRSSLVDCSARDSR